MPNKVARSSCSCHADIARKRNDVRETPLFWMSGGLGSTYEKWSSVATVGACKVDATPEVEKETALHARMLEADSSAVISSWVTPRLHFQGGGLTLLWVVSGWGIKHGRRHILFGEAG